MWGKTVFAGKERIFWNAQMESNRPGCRKFINLIHSNFHTLKNSGKKNRTVIRTVLGFGVVPKGRITYAINTISTNSEPPLRCNTGNLPVWLYFAVSLAVCRQREEKIWERVLETIASEENKKFMGEFLDWVLGIPDVENAVRNQSASDTAAAKPTEVDKIFKKLFDCAPDSKTASVFTGYRYSSEKKGKIARSLSIFHAGPDGITFTNILYDSRKNSSAFKRVVQGTVSKSLLSLYLTGIDKNERSYKSVYLKFESDDGQLESSLHGLVQTPEKNDVISARCYWIRCIREEVWDWAVTEGWIGDDVPKPTNLVSLADPVRDLSSITLQTYAAKMDEKTAIGFLTDEVNALEMTPQNLTENPYLEENSINAADLKDYLKPNIGENGVVILS